MIDRSREIARLELKELERKNFLEERQAGKKNIYIVRSKDIKKVLHR